MNLAAALDAERELAAEAAGPMPLRALMRLAAETDGQNRKRRKMDGGDGGPVDVVCCVRMERNKGAAFIPCGYTYFRVCSRELWLNRGSCPLLTGRSPKSLISFRDQFCDYGFFYFFYFILCN